MPTFPSYYAGQRAVVTAPGSEIVSEHARVRFDDDVAPKRVSVMCVRCGDQPRVTWPAKPPTRPEDTVPPAPMASIPYCVTCNNAVGRINYSI